MRIALTIAIFTIAATTVKGQDIQLLPTQKEVGDSTNSQQKEFIVVKGEEISRFPSSDFMEAVNGLFPWIFSQSYDPNEFLFVINGFVLPDINSISLNDIEEIIFTRNNLYGTLFPFSRAGTFLITTKTAKGKKLHLDFNSQYNIVWNKNGSLPASAFGFYNTTKASYNRSDNENGDYWSNHLSLSFAGKKLRGYLSAQANEEKASQINQYTIFPEPAPFADTITSSLANKFTSQRIFLDLSYNFSKKLQIGVMADYSHHRFKQQSDRDIVSGPYYQNARAAATKAPLNYYHAAIFVNYRITKNLVNTLWAEYEFEKMQWDYAISNLNQPSQITGTSKADPKNKDYLFRDQLLYNLFSGKKFTSTVSMIATYLRHNFSGEIFNQNASGFNIYKIWGKEKIATLNPLFNFSYQHVISGYFGATYLVGKKTFQHVGKDDKQDFYSGIEMNFTRFLKTKKVLSGLGLSADYSNLLKNNSNNYWLNPLYLSHAIFPSGQFAQGPITFNFNDPVYKVDLLENKLLAFRINAAFLNDRLQIVTEWSQLKTQKNYLVSVPPPYFTTIVPGSETIQGLSAAVSGKIVDSKKTKFSSAFNLLFPKTKGDQVATMTGTVFYRSLMRAGWQNKLEYKNFFVRVTALFDIDHVYYLSSGIRPVTEKHNDFSINYFLIGYRPNIRSTSSFKNVSVFLQFRNLFVTRELRKYYLFDHYGGIGVDLSF